MNTLSRFLIISFSLFVLGASSASAQTSGPCSSERAHEFDFWIGDWVVTANGVLAGHNRIEPILDGCVIQENWEGAGGGKGSSYNFFNPSLGKWQQFWVWQNGTTLYLTGDYSEGKMMLEGSSINRAGATMQNRITWFDNEDGTVRQLWEVSADDGETWTTSFDGLYEQKEK